ncbi:MAG: hypothetical protein PVI81_00935 [Anaerolineales bacterium]|jgi:hypothetical protein
MFLQAPAETMDFMLLGFAVILGTMGLFILSLFMRYRNLKRDLEVLEEIEVPD